MTVPIHRNPHATLTPLSATVFPAVSGVEMATSLFPQSLFEQFRLHAHLCIHRLQTTVLVFQSLQLAGHRGIMSPRGEVVKTDRRDARGLAQLLRMGWYRPAHRKSASSQEMRALLAGRRQMHSKAIDLEQTLRGLLRGFGMKISDVSRGKFAARIRELVAGQEMLMKIVESLLSARDAIWREFAKLHREVLAIVKADETCRRLMTTPGVGAVVSALS